MNRSDAGNGITVDGLSRECLMHTLSWAMSARKTDGYFRNLNYKEKRCVNLQPAGTGTVRLNSIMVDQNFTYPKHSHRRNCYSLMQCTCFMITLRDPISRLESGFRYALQTWRNGRSFWAKSRKALLKTNATNVVRSLILRYQNGASHRDLQNALKRFVPKNFLWTQQSYLYCNRGNVDLFVFCTETLTHQIASYFNVNASTFNNRTGSSQVNELTEIEGAYEREFVRNVLFPGDSILHQLFCSQHFKNNS
jgi:hypothetical protein